MTTKAMRLTQSAANFAARFGFIHQSLFFTYFCRNLKSQQYNYWNKLVTSGQFQVSASDRHVLYLSAKGRRLAQFDCVPARNIYLIPHDILVGKLLLELELSGLVVDSWTEAELLCSPATTYQVLGVNRIDKRPDLVVDLSMPNRSFKKTLRIAFEIEKSRKAKERYDRMAMNYLAMKSIHLVFFGVGNPMIAQAIQRAFSGDIFEKNQKSPIIFANEEFNAEELSAQAELLQVKMPIKQMLFKALEGEEAIQKSLSETEQNSPWPFPENSSDKNADEVKQYRGFATTRPNTGPLASFRDHPLPTNTLREGGHEPGAGVGRGPDRNGEEEY